MFFRLSIRAQIVCVSLILTASCQLASAQQSNSFDIVAGSPSGEFAWDGFTGSYGAQHSPDALNIGIGNAFLSVSPVPGAPGGIVGPPGLPGDLYAHDTTPTYQLDLGSLDDSEAFTSVAVQFAITKSFLPPMTRSNLTAASFSLTGVGGPDEFEFLGARTQLPGNGGTLEDIDYFWAEWIGVSSATDLEIIVNGSLGQFQILTATKVSYFNTSTPLNITSVPEPSAGILPLLFGACFLKRRRNS